MFDCVRDKVTFSVSVYASDKVCVSVRLSVFVSTTVSESVRDIVSVGVVVIVSDSAIVSVRVLLRAWVQVNVRVCSSVDDFV